MLNEATRNVVLTATDADRTREGQRRPQAALVASIAMSEQRAERVAYAVAVVILVVGGALLRTPILNWICGPATS
jgi:hypothetical protein